MRNVNDYICIMIRRLRLARGISLKAAALRSGIPQSSYAFLEAGHYRITLENLFRIVHALGVHIADVWPGGAPISPPVRVTSEYILAWTTRAQAEADRRHPDLECVLQAVAESCDLTLKQLASAGRERREAQARALAAVAIVEDFRHLTLWDLAHRLKRHPSSISHARRRLLERAKNSPTKAEWLETKMADVRRRVEERYLKEFAHA